MKKNFFDKIQDEFASKIKQFQEREDYEILKKVPFWLIIFFPYALYLILFKSNVNKFIKLIIISFFIFICMVFADISINPNRVYNDVGLKSYNEFVNKNDKLNLEEASYVYKTSHFELNNNMYFSFAIYDKLNMYYGIFKINDYNKNYELVSLYNVDYNFENLYSINEFKVVKDIHPVVLSFLLSKCGEEVDINDIKAKGDLIDDNVFENIISQDIEINNKVYNFKLSDFDVLEIKNDNKLLYEYDLNDSISSHISSSSVSLLNKNFGSNYNLVGYNYINNEHYYNVTVGDNYYCIKYEPGKNIDLLHISNLEDFKNHIKSLMM